MKHLIYSILLFILFYSVSSAQNNIILKGQVVDAQTLQGLNSANLVVENSGKGTSTLKDGSFELSIPAAENTYIEITYIGYDSRRIKLSEILASKTPVIIKLEPGIIPSQSVLVTGAIAKEGITPISFSKIKRKAIEETYTIQDVPEYLSTLPSTTFYSESGSTLGYNYISIRGFDQRRISVAINGIPQNDPEDHNVYWLDFPDILSSTEFIQVQRGAGSGVIGYPSIGGSINIITSSFSDKPLYQLSAIYGSYNTRKYSAEYASGLLNKKYSFYAKFSKTLSSGYRDRSWVDYNAFHLSGVRYDDKLTTQINVFGGPISDGLAYNGLPKSFIKNKELRTENYSWWSIEDGNLYFANRRSEEQEKFSQPHFELLNEYTLNKDVKFNSGLFLVLGQGYYDYDGSWADTSYFRLTGQYGYNPTGNPDNAMIRAEVKNVQYGWIPRISIKHNSGEFAAGAELRIHRSSHWGNIIQAGNLPSGVTEDYRYYDYKGAKDILNLFVHETYNFSPQLSVLTELQTAMFRYRLYDEKFVNTDFTIKKIFLNPRIGLNYRLSPENSLYFSYANVSREPRLKNYYDAAESSDGETSPAFEKNLDGSYDFGSPLVKPENMNDFELGGNFAYKSLSLTANVFYMIFNNEIVKIGQLDRFGQPVTGNMDRTIHKGIELTFRTNISKYVDLIINTTYSKNYISRGDAFKKNDTLYVAEKLDGNRIAGFPDLLLNGILTFRYSGLFASLSARYSGSYYSDNYDKKMALYLTESDEKYDNRVDPYLTADAFLSWQLKELIGLNKMKLYFQVTNLFDRLYASYAIGKEFYPAAERNFSAGIELGL